MGRIAEEEKEELQVNLDMVEQIFCNHFCRKVRTIKTWMKEQAMTRLSWACVGNKDCL